MLPDACSNAPRALPDPPPPRPSRLSVFRNSGDYDFVLEQLAANATVNISMIDQDISYGIFGLRGSSKAIRFLKSSCGRSGSHGSASSSPEAPEGIVYCGGQRQIEYVILDGSSSDWNAFVTVNGQTTRAMTSYSYFGNAQPPRGFVVALLGEDRSELFVFQDRGQNWVEYGDGRYNQCN